MTEAEKIWAEKTKIVRSERGGTDTAFSPCRQAFYSHESACRLIEEFEAFKQEVSDAVEMLIDDDYNLISRDSLIAFLSRFIIAKPEPDPLETAMRKALPASMPDHHVKAICKNLRRELPGLKIVEVDDD